MNLQKMQKLSYDSIIFCYVLCMGSIEIINTLYMANISTLSTPYS